MSNEGIPDAAFFSWLDEHMKWALERAESVVGNPEESARAMARYDTLREVRAYFGVAS